MSKSPSTNRKAEIARWEKRIVRSAMREYSAQTSEGAYPHRIALHNACRALKRLRRS